MPVPRKPTRKQELTAVILDAGHHLSLSKNTVNALTKFAVNSDDDSLDALLQLLAQPDPHGSLSGFLPYKIRDTHADWTDSTEEEFARWVKDAALCFHQVDTYIKLYGNRKDRSLDDSYLSARFISGMRHYHAIDPGYTDEQIVSLAMIATAAHAAYFKEFDRTGAVPLLPDINSGHVCDHSWCSYVVSPTIIGLATSSHDTAARILSIITDDGVATEAHILYRLGDGPRALLQGTL